MWGSRSFKSAMEGLAWAEMKQVDLESGNGQVGRSNHNPQVEREHRLPRTMFLTEPSVNVSEEWRNKLKRVILGYRTFVGP